MKEENPTGAIHPIHENVGQALSATKVETSEHITSEFVEQISKSPRRSAIRSRSHNENLSRFLEQDHTNRIFGLMWLEMSHR